MATLSHVLRLTSLQDQVYSMEAEDGWQYHWNATKGRHLAEQRGDVFLFSPQEFGITTAHIQARYEGLDEVYAMTTDLSRPLLFVPLQGQVLLIDGWHRLFKAVVTGVPAVPAYLLDEEEAEAILLCKLPPGQGLNWGQNQ